MAERINNNQTGSKIEKYGWYAALGGFGVALLGIAVGLPPVLNRSAAWVGVGGTAAVIGATIFKRTRNKN